MIPILYRDNDFIIVEKPAGMLVHPSNEARQVKISLLHELKKQIGLYLYPIHRLDRPVSGLIVFGLNKEMSRDLMQSWNSPQTKKEYRTLTRRQLVDPGIINFPLKSDNGVEKECETHYWPLKVFKDFTYLKVEIKTGRRHQIRRHFSRRCFNIVGDTKYGKGVINNFFRDSFGFHQIFLYSKKIEFIHPRSKGLISIESDLPRNMQEIIQNLSSLE